MKKVIYEGNIFNGWDDAENMMGCFSEDISALKGCKVIYADYETGSYDGWCFVLFKRGRKLYEVNGSHCSCYGLEGQWDPEETSIDALYITKPNIASMIFGPQEKK